MPNFKSWQDYWLFERTVKIKSRYFHDETIESFLNLVLETCKQRIKGFPKNKFLWRAQLGHGWQQIHQDGEYIDDIPAPFEPERMIPLLNEATEGRVNPKGIPYLYLATDKETAMAEVRPWLGSPISVGQFKIKKNLRLIDCSVNLSNSFIYIEEPSQEEKERAVWTHIDRAFSRPTTNSDRGADYVPTQILAELFKTHGYDGIIYKSLLEKGYSIALFDLNSAKLVNCFLYEVSEIGFKFNQTANPYFVKKEMRNG